MLEQCGKTVKRDVQTLIKRISIGRCIVIGVSQNTFSKQTVQLCILFWTRKYILFCTFRESTIREKRFIHFFCYVFLFF